ncbi:MAG TPA: gfo/Idh/MocA family oxidoreductase, partial [Clostridiales bacterium]|nr:gfo/Idh/MocA family oxidoreductase [Clostridiales bacterium]
MKETYKIAIIGCGSISHSHVSAIQTGNLGEIVALCDTREDRIQGLLAKVPGAKTYTDYQVLLSETEANIIHICTPHYLHAEMAIASMQAGKDVYLEKPAAMDYEQGMEIVRVSEKTGKKVCVSFQNRLIESHLTLRKLIDSGEYGKVLGLKGIVTWYRGGKYYTDSGWRGEWETEGGGTLMNQSIHTLDLLYYFGGPVERVEGSVALRKNKGTIHVEDTAEATIWFKNGATAIFYATNCHVATNPIILEVVCEKASFSLRDNKLYKTMGKTTEVVAENSALAVG